LKVKLFAQASTCGLEVAFRNTAAKQRIEETVRMSPATRSLATRILRTLSAVRTGIILLILVGLASAVGTVILQRPLTDAEDMTRAYSPATLQWLDGLGLTDVFHSRWFVFLLTLLSVNIILASLERLPAAWRYVSRPYLRPEPHFVAGLPLQQEIPIRNESAGVEAAERAFRRLGLDAQRVGANKESNGSVSLYAEKHRFARLAAYIVHASLLLIFAGGIADALWGYRGFVAMTRGEEVNEIELRDGARMPLGFTVRCESAGQENYPDGTPQRWWSKLTVLENGREVKQKEIEVNEPLVHRGLRFFQSSYGATGQADIIHLTAAPKKNPQQAQEIALRVGQTTQLDAGTTVRLAAFVPDFILAGREIQTRSNQPNNPALQLIVESKKGGESKVWLFPRFPGFGHPDESPYAFQFRNLEMGYFTGLQVAYEPGQWAVWAGVILMGVGLVTAFYFVHVRYWAVPVNDGRGRLVLWIGASASKNRDEFEGRFNRLVQEIKSELETKNRACAAAKNCAVPARG
jgi:cytochrome c biogenesis protein